MKHECRESHTCCCSMQAVEPDEDCPIHGCGPWPPKCEICGRFLRWEVRLKQLTIKGEQSCGTRLQLAGL